MSSPGLAWLHGLLQRLAACSPPVFVMGGVAEDAVLHRRLTRTPADLDLLVPRPQVNQQRQQLRALGLIEQAHGAADHALVLIAPEGPLHLELWVCDPVPGGGYLLEVPGQPPPSRYRLTLPADTFQFPATTIDGVAIQTVSPLALHHLRAASALTRSRGEAQDKDRWVQAQLRQTFLLQRNEDELQPRIVKL